MESDGISQKPEIIQRVIAMNILKQYIKKNNGTPFDNAVKYAYEFIQNCQDDLK